MTIARRLAGLETSMTPTQRIVAWLDEAHAFGRLEAYVESLLDQPPEAFPINRLAREAIAGERAPHRGRASEGTDMAVRKALRETVFRFELVMRINVTAHETVDRAALVHGVLSSQMALLTSMAFGGETQPGTSDRLSACRDIASRRVDELLALGDARA